uniref:JHL05D22.2 protein n=1 Tax=Rhizophora mucronata TaxID=61149 RepID=A0A2P2JYA4_RHIMU
MHQNLPLGTGERGPLNSVSHLPPFLLQFRILRSFQGFHLRVHSRCTDSGPYPVQAVRAKRRVLGFPEPNRPDRRIALGVTVAEIKWKIGMCRLYGRPVE